MRCDRLPLAAVLLALAVAPGAASMPAGAPGDGLEVRVPEGPVAVGDRVQVTVTAPGGPRRWASPEVAGDPDTWAAAGSPEELGPGQWRLELVPLRTGTLPLPEIRVRTADGASLVAPAGAAEVEVASVLPPGATPPPPAPLRDPVGVHGPPWEWLPPVLALLLPLGGLAWLVRRRLRRKGPADAAGRVPELPPLKELEGALRDIRARLASVPAEESCDRLAAALRRYLERRLGEPAMEMTSFELFRLARSRGWPSPRQAALRRVLETADRVRFARARVPRAELEAAVETAGDLARALELEHARPDAEEVA